MAARRFSMQFNLRLLLTFTLLCGLGFGLWVERERANRLEAELATLQSTHARTTNELAIARLHEHDVSVRRGTQLQLWIDHRIDPQAFASLRNLQEPFTLSLWTRIIQQQDAQDLFPPECRLECLLLNHCTLEPGVATRLKNLTRLVRLELYDVKAKNGELWGVIEHLPIEHLVISKWNLSQSDLAAIRLGPGLKTLELHGTAPTRDTLAALPSLDRLQALVLPQTSFSNEERELLVAEFPNMQLLKPGKIYIQSKPQSAKWGAFPQSPP